MRYFVIIVICSVSGCQSCQPSWTLFGPRTSAAIYESPPCTSRYLIPAPAPTLAPAPAESSVLPPVAETPRPPIVTEKPTVEVGPPRVRVERTPTESTPRPNVNIPKADDSTPPAIDLPGFVAALPGVASGLQPFPDGQDWLARKGYKNVLHLRGLLDDTTAAKRQFEKKGLAYQSIIVSPATLSRESVDEFVRIVSDINNHPLFVYDKDGSSAGAMWYLFNKYHLKSDEAKSSAEAKRLGLRDDDEEHKAMWIAVQALLNKSSP